MTSDGRAAAGGRPGAGTGRAAADGRSGAEPARAIGILGGTFDPIHEAHLALARQAMTELDLEHVLFVPNADPPHKHGQAVTPVHHREAMVALAIEAHPAFRLSRLELERPGPSYAVDTVAELAAKSEAEGRPPPWFILSVEALEGFHTWREPERILELCRVAVAPRPGADEVDRAWLASRFPGLEDRFHLLAGPDIDIASTTIRERVARGEQVTDLVPAAVERYIQAEGLYRQEQPGGSASLAHVADTEERDIGSDDDGRTAAARPAQAESGTAVSSADPRTAPRPGLPVGRRKADAAGPRLTIIPGAVDEEVLALAHRIVELASDKKASDIVLLDVRSQTTMTDYFVICSGASDRQLNAIADGIAEGVKEDGTDGPLSREGVASSHWLLIDFGGVIVHVMSTPERDFYQLEKLWSEASLLLHIL